jgi:catechol 2,3-dioxygenase-like lactoylglutathione lyase family enzyme
MVHGMAVQWHAHSLGTMRRGFLAGRTRAPMDAVNHQTTPTDPTDTGPIRRPQGDRAMDYKLELVLVPVTDVDRAKAFYTDDLSFNCDVDHRAGDDFRVVQLTPPGSACSIAVGIGITDAEPGAIRGTHLVVADIVAARGELTGRGVKVSDIRHMGSDGWQPGPHPEHADYASFADFSDPDGNTWVLQEARRGGATA